MITTKQVWDSVRKRKGRNYEHDLKDWEQYLMETTYQNYVDIIIEEARSWLGVPFHHQGRTKNGCDCIGVGLACARRVGFKYEDYTRYGRLPHHGLLEKAFMQYLVQIDVKDIRPADGVLITWKADPHHVAIVTRIKITGKLGILHCYQTVGKVVEHHLDDNWKKRIVMAFRFPFMDELLKSEGKQ